VPLRRHRVEHAGHPDGRGERRLVGNEAISRSEDQAVWAEDAQLLGSEHDVAARACEERVDSSTFPLDFAHLPAEESADVALAEIAARKARAAAEQRRRWSLFGTIVSVALPGSCFRHRENSIHVGQILVRAGAFVVAEHAGGEPY